MNNQRLLPITSGDNFRELGGYKTTDGRQVKWHKIIRSGSLGNLNEQDQQFLSIYGVDYDIDLRSKEEALNDPDRIPENEITYHLNSLFDEDQTDNSKDSKDLDTIMTTDENYGINHMKQVYRNMITDKGALKAFNYLFSILLENTTENKSVLFHCAAGKDRTGMAAVFILSALGVDLETIRNDYLLTNAVVQHVIDRRIELATSEGANSIMQKNLKVLYSVSEEFLDAALDEISKKYGDINNFLHNGIGLSDDDITELQKNYLI
ncbi:protein-tyrosine-phosphatase [Lactobacillus sp. S2-2]|uniref:tyrosine-protein phosphatase n=1 Tax=Lactobacillus sp. S2-2 TaxID=2692917 RepID=UPI001F46BBF1|nr:tyrosine-protein phosphatase [Lactobacillus sp. S2-2]MCF6515253.1 protein-tyrosine-phosphatase [Lactobacillus sp. S2-2]